MTAWLDIVGMTEGGTEAMTAESLARIGAADVVIGVARRLDALPIHDGVERVVWDGNLVDMLDRIAAFKGRKTVLLASGDPNWFGIGATLAHRLSPSEFALHPVPSSFQLAASRLQWPMQHLATISLHGRPLSALHPHVLPGNRILALTSDGRTPSEVGALLVARGYGSSRMTVLENLGGENEKIFSFAAHEAIEHTIGSFHVLAIDCVADSSAPLYPPIPGLPDSAFENDGQLTKSEVRAITLSKLCPFPGALLWDVGAGSGSVGVEWMRAARDARAICFERNLDRLNVISRNRLALGVPLLELIGGDAPESFAGQPNPDAVFLGGDVSNENLFTACWAALKPGGRLVANAVTLDAEAAFARRQASHGGTLIRLSVETLDRIGDERVFRPRMTVTQWSVRKETE